MAVRRHQDIVDVLVQLAFNVQISPMPSDVRGTPLKAAMRIPKLAKAVINTKSRAIAERKVRGFIAEYGIRHLVPPGFCGTILTIDN